MSTFGGNIGDPGPLPPPGVEIVNLGRTVDVDDAAWWNELQHRVLVELAGWYEAKIEEAAAPIVASIVTWCGLLWRRHAWICPICGEPMLDVSTWADPAPIAYVCPNTHLDDLLPSRP